MILKWISRVCEEEGGEGGGGGGTTTMTKTADGGEGDKPWYDGISDDYRVDFVTQSPDLQTFVKSAVETKKLVGANTIAIPGEKATDEQRAAFFEKLGRPKESGAYSHSENVKFGEGIEISSDKLDDFKKTMHGLGLSAAQGKGILDWYVGFVNGEAESQSTTVEAQRNQADNALRQEWGDKYDVNVDVARSALRKFDADGALTNILESTGLGNEPALVRFFNKIGAALADDSASGDGTGGFTSSQTSAIQRIEKLKYDKEFQTALGSAQDPGHRAALEEWEALHRQAYPGKSEA